MLRVAPRATQNVRSCLHDSPSSELHCSIVDSSSSPPPPPPAHPRHRHRHRHLHLHHHQHRDACREKNAAASPEALDSYTFTSILRSCTQRRSGADGRAAHALLLFLSGSILANVYVGTSLVNMYAKCGMLDDAYDTFLRMPHATAFTWNTIILACIRAGRTRLALCLYISMLCQGCVSPDEVTLITVIRVFTGLRDAEQGSLVLSQLIMDGSELTVPLCNALLDLYVKCQRTEDAVGLFEHVMCSRDVISWTHMITAHINCNDGMAALGYFFRLLASGIQPDETAFAAVLHACAMLGDGQLGKELHSHMLETAEGMASNLFIGDTLVDMYSKCGSIDDAENVFYSLPTRSVVSWNSLLTGYVTHEHAGDALTLFCQMQSQGMEASAITFVSILNACISIEDLEFGMVVHARAVDTGFESLTIVGNALSNMYMSCKSILDAEKVFLEMGEHSVVSWNTMISGLTKHGHAWHAVDLFKRMVHSCVAPDAVTYVSVINAVASTQSLYHGWIIHSNITEMVFQADYFMENALIDMYSKCRTLPDAWQVFNNMSSRDIVSFNAILYGLSIEELHEEVIDFCFTMKNEGTDPDQITFVRALNGCASIGCLERGCLAHALVIEYGYEQDVFISSNLIDMYIRAQSLESAQRVFDRTSDQDIVSWTLILAGYIDNGQENHALEIFGQLVVANFRHDEFTLMNAVNACANLAALDKGKMVHALIVELGFEKCNLVCNALIDMYSKSGSTVDARGVLDAMPARNVVSWNSMISGYAEHGQGEVALQLVNQMQLERISLNRISSLGILSACSHTGLSTEGYGHFKFMNQAHGVKPTMDHYACMVDLVGRTGHLEEALCFIRKMPVEPSVDVWKALLRVSHIHSNPSLGKMAAEKVLRQDPMSATTYVMLSNIYGSLGLWNERAQIIKDSEGQSDSKAGWL